MTLTNEDLYVRRPEKTGWQRNSKHGCDRDFFHLLKVIRVSSSSSTRPRTV